jgi:hypothetical protein
MKSMSTRWMPWTVVVMTVVMMAVVGAAHAADKPVADKPNFSGTWKMNAAKSDFGGAPPPESFVRTIDHKEPSITIVEQQTGPGATPTSTRKMTTDGKPAEVDISGALVNLAASWDGATLIATTTIDNLGVKFTDKMSLAADGKELESHVQIESAQGNLAIKVVFEKQ